MRGVLVACGGAELGIYATSSDDALRLRCQIVTPPVRYPLYKALLEAAAFVASCGGDSVCVSSVHDARVVMQLTQPEEDSLLCIDFEKSGRIVAAGGEAGVLSIWDVKRQNVVRRIDDHTSAIRAVRFDSAGGSVASADAGGEVLLHRVRSKQLLARLAVREGRAAVSALEFSPISARAHVLGALHGDGSVRIWDTYRAETVAELLPTDTGRGRGAGEARGLAFSPVNHKFVASTTLCGAVGFWDLEQRRCVKVLDAGAAVTALAFASECVVVAGLASGRVAAYDLRNTAEPVAYFDASRPHVIETLHHVAVDARRPEPRGDRRQPDFGDTSLGTAFTSADARESADARDRPSRQAPEWARPTPDKAPRPPQSQPPPTPLPPSPPAGPAPSHYGDDRDEDDDDRDDDRDDRDDRDDDNGYEAAAPSRKDTGRQDTLRNGASLDHARDVDLKPAASRDAHESAASHDAHAPRAPSADGEEVSETAALRCAMDEVRRDVQNLHLDVLRQFEMQHSEISAMLRAHTDQFARVLADNDALRRENDALRKKRETFLDDDDDD